MVAVFTVISGRGHAETVQFAGKVIDNWWVPVSDAHITVAWPNGNVQAVTDEAGLYNVNLENVPLSISSSVDNPAAFTLSQNFPNPFNPSTTIHYYCAERQHVRLSVFSMSGQLVTKLVNEISDTGDHFVIWNGMDDEGHHAGTGVYLYRIEAGGMSETKKMLLLDGGSVGGSVPAVSKRAAYHEESSDIQLTITIDRDGYRSSIGTVTVPVSGGTASFESKIIRLLPEGIDDNDMKYILGKALEMVLNPQIVYDSDDVGKLDSIYVSTKNVDIGLVPEIPGKTIVFLTPDEIQNKADTTGDFPYYSYGEYSSPYIQISGEKITISMTLSMAIKKDAGYIMLWGGGYTADFTRKEDNGWDIRIYNQWIS